ncbi:vegetative cell wall protein gp1-like isoform X2 [Triticum urartu]|nr:vegetative cell wall protein gp1-like isoform X2 [Triticum urartu]
MDPAMPRRSGDGSSPAAPPRRRGRASPFPTVVPATAPNPLQLPSSLPPEQQHGSGGRCTPLPPPARAPRWRASSTGSARRSSPLLPTPPTPSHLPDQVAAPLVLVSSSPPAAPLRPQRNHSSSSRSMESDDHGRVARRHEMWFSAPVGVVHERVGDDGINAVHSGSCRGALWWPLWYSSVAGQLGDATGAVS